MRGWAHAQPNKIAFIDTDRMVTYGQLQREIDLMRRALLQAGVGPGDRIVTIIPSGIEFVVLLFAAMQLGANLIPLDMLLTEEDVATRVAATKPKIAFAAWDTHARAVRWANIRVIMTRKSDGADVDVAAFIAEAASSPRSFAMAPAPETMAEYAVSAAGTAEPTLPILTIFTSGSTGAPKGVLLSEQSLAHAIASINDAVGATSDDVFLTALPISHIYGINTGVLLPMAVGATSVLVSKFAPGTILDAMEEHAVSVFNGVPSMYRRLTAEQKEHPRSLSAMRTGTIAGAQCTNLEDYQRILHCKPRILYGSTECPIVASTRGGDSLDVEETGVGRFVPTVEARICDDDGNPVQCGQEGEIVCKSPGLMLGYLDDPAATRTCVDKNGWMHMGDIAYQDEHGYVHIVGRKSDIVNRGGYKISPAEVERAYADHPDVAVCCVMGLPHTELGQQIVMFAELSQPQITTDELRDYAKARVAKFKIPDQIIIVEKMPYLPNGKLDKHALTRRFETDAQVFHNDAELHEQLRGKKAGCLSNTEQSEV